MLMPSAVPPRSVPSAARSAMPALVPTKSAVVLDETTAPVPDRRVSAGRAWLACVRRLDVRSDAVPREHTRRRAAVGGQNGALAAQIFQQRRSPHELAKIASRRRRRRRRR